MSGYPARIRKERSGCVVSFRDIPEALTSGATKKEAVEMATDALATAMEFYVEDRRRVPLPSNVRKREQRVDLPTSVVAKVRLLNKMLEENALQAGSRPPPG